MIFSILMSLRIYSNLLVAILNYLYPQSHIQGFVCNHMYKLHFSTATSTLNFMFFFFGLANMYQSVEVNIV